MDIQEIDQSYQQLETQSQQTIQALTALAGKLSAAAQGGDQNAREWQLDLREIALGMQAEQNQMTSLLQAIHSFVGEAVQSQSSAPQSYQQPQYQQAQYQQPEYQQAPYPQQGQYAQGGAGGMVQKFLGGGFGRAIVSGAGFGIGDDLINHLFR